MSDSELNCYHAGYIKLGLSQGEFQSPIVRGRKLSLDTSDLAAGGMKREQCRSVD